MDHAGRRHESRRFREDSSVPEDWLSRVSAPGPPRPRGEKRAQRRAPEESGRAARSGGAAGGGAGVCRGGTGAPPAGCIRLAGRRALPLTPSRT